MPLKYQSGEDIRCGDCVSYRGNPGFIELVVDGLAGDSETDWYFETLGPGVMVREPEVIG